MNRIMIDLETLGTQPGSIILSIGAVRFDLTHGITGEFYTNIDVEDSQRHGLTLTASTVVWWMTQSDEARKALASAKRPLRDALERFTKWARPEDFRNAPIMFPIDELWGNGSDFDNALLASAYKAAGLGVPWSYRANRCYRTMWSMFPEVPFEKPATAHNALEDARAQAIHLQRILLAKGVETEAMKASAANILSELNLPAIGDELGLAAGDHIPKHVLSGIKELNARVKELEVENDKLKATA